MLSRLREFSTDLTISLQRMGRDRRARVFVIRVGFSVAYTVVVLRFFIYLFFHSDASPASSVGYSLATFTVALAVFALLRRSHKRENDFLKFSLTGQREPVPQVHAAVEQYLRDRMVILASLVARAASEAQLRKHPIPKGAVPVMRQRQNTLLRETGLWEKLEPEEEALAAAADGQWTTEQVNGAEIWCEQLRLLRWVLGMDSILTPLTHFPRSDFALTEGLLEPRSLPPHVPPGSKPGQLLGERNMATQYVGWIYAEINRRRTAKSDALADPQTENIRSWKPGPSSDLWAGAKTVGELSDQDLGILGMVAFARGQYAEYLVKLLAAENPFPFAPPVAKQA
jgi:hypothetical protein